MTVSISKLILSTCALVSLISTTQVSANPSSASKCDLWGAAGGSYGPHKKEAIGTTGGNAVTIAAATYAPNTPVTLTVTTAATFQGFQIYAIDANKRRVGTFTTTGLNSEAAGVSLVQVQNCNSGDDNAPWVAGSTMHHKSSVPKPKNMQLNWIADPTAAGVVSFIATVMPNSAEFYQATIKTLPRSAAAPAPVSYVPVAEIAAPIVVGPPVVSPILTTPTDGKLTIQGLGTAQVFNPYDNNLMQQALEENQAKKAREAKAQAEALLNGGKKQVVGGGNAGGSFIAPAVDESKFGIFEGGSFGGGSNSQSRVFNPAAAMKSDAHRAHAAVAAATLLTVASIVASMML